MKVKILKINCYKNPYNSAMKQFEGKIGTVKEKCGNTLFVKMPGFSAYYFNKKDCKEITK